jgi:hypothetical protein
MRHETEELAAANQLAAEKRKADQLRAMDEQSIVELEARKQAAQLQKRDGADKLRELVDAPMVYADEPLQDGVLTITDRRIDLDGPIVSGTADYVCDRIDYFNNLDEGERTALVTFLDAIGKIIAADAHPSAVPDPSDPPASVKMTRQKAEEVVREAIRRNLERKARRGGVVPGGA